MNKEWQIWDRNPSEPNFIDYTYIKHIDWELENKLEFDCLHIPRDYVLKILEKDFTSKSDIEEIYATVILLEVNWNEMVSEKSAIINKFKEETEKQMLWDFLCINDLLEE